MEKKNNLERVTTFICFDIETTGLNPEKDRIIEIGALKVKEGRITEHFSELINPGMELPTLITNLTGISNAMLEDAPPLSKVLGRFLAFVEDYPLMGHNVRFDYSFVKTAAVGENLTFNRKGIDTLELCKRLHPDLESRSLESMCRFYGITNDHAHRAHDDAKATVLLYVNLCNGYFNENRELFQPRPLLHKVKKSQPITGRQKNYLLDLIKYHKIDFEQPLEELTQSEASRWIDKIILENGRIV